MEGMSKGNFIGLQCNDRPLAFTCDLVFRMFSALLCEMTVCPSVLCYQMSELSRTCCSPKVQPFRIILRENSGEDRRSDLAFLTHT
ncbi:hypothetical protein LIA77_05897 [Sarocladium implicatum]|nr:hypothetical protein LIA77_05897 [Sarocladium implicatum]